MWCPLPWIHLGVKNNGSLRMCCHSQSAGNRNTLLQHNGRDLTIADLDQVDVINCDTLKQVRQDMLNHKWPAQCRRCQTESLANMNSRNQWETVAWASSFTRDMALAMTAADGSVSGLDWRDFDLRIGNICNIRCVMCSPGESDKWYESWQEIFDTDQFHVDGKPYDFVSAKQAFAWSKHRQNIDSLLNSSRQLSKIFLSGGEPLLIPYHRYMLETLIADGRAAHVDLEYNSNITVVPKKLCDLWRRFRHVTVCASVDALGSANDAIRWPSTWHTIESNLRLLDTLDMDITLGINTTIGILSLEHYGDLLCWMKDQNFSKIHELADHPIYNPRYFSISILEPHQLNRLLSHSSAKVSHMPKLLKKMQNYETFYKNTRMSDSEAAPHRLQFIKLWDRFQQDQQQDWYSIFPLAGTVVDEWKTRYGL